jgi:acyl-CoA reductase-like NAD-dependent aldehyde dehydrogenase
MKFITEAKAEAHLQTGGNRVGDKGYFIEPTVFVDVKPNARINKQEVFGPVAIVHTFETEEEALALANDTYAFLLSSGGSCIDIPGSEYGLSAGVFTRDLVRAHRVAAKLQSGGVGVNQNSTVSCMFALLARKIWLTYCTGDMSVPLSSSLVATLIFCAGRSVASASLALAEVSPLLRWHH